MSLTFADARVALVAPGGLDEQSTVALIDLLLSGSLAPEEGADLLVTWAQRGETGAELAAVVRALRARAVPVALTRSSVDVVGTGGVEGSRFNVSTTVAFVLASAGVAVAKHGNRGSRSPNGSFDFLEALGIPIDLPPAALTTLHQDHGLCFLFARALHPAMAAAVPYRKLAARRTIFNLAGPLANPAPVDHLLIGAVDQRSALVLAQALRLLGDGRALVVCGEPGIDEVSISGPTHTWNVTAQDINQGILTPAPQSVVDRALLPGGDATTNAALFARLIAGDPCDGLAEMVQVNAGLVFDLLDGQPPVYHGPGYHRAAQRLADGRVARFFTAYQAAAVGLA